MRHIIPADRAGDFNQSLMELGAMVCLGNGEPKCLVCPLREICEGFRQGIAGELPVKAPKKPRKREEKNGADSALRGAVCPAASGQKRDCWRGCGNCRGWKAFGEQDALSNQLEKQGAQVLSIRPLAPSPAYFHPCGVAYAGMGSGTGNTAGGLYLGRQPDHGGAVRPAFRV